MSTFDTLVDDLTRDVHRAQPKDALQFCANWFQSRLEEQRARTRDILAQRSYSVTGSLPKEIYVDTPLDTVANGTAMQSSFSPFTVATPPRLSHKASLPAIERLRDSVSVRDSVSLRGSISHQPSPFGTLNVPGNALLSEDQDGPPTFQIDGRDMAPTSPLTTGVPNPFAGFDGNNNLSAVNANPGDYLHPPMSAIFARRTSVSAESILVDSGNDEPTPVYQKTPEQLSRIRASIGKNFIFRDLDEEQETGVLNAMQEQRVSTNEVVIRQGDVGEYFYVVESGLLHCYIHAEPLPPSWVTENKNCPGTIVMDTGTAFVQPGYHPEFGREVAKCTPGNSFGELALMYGHPRAATVLAKQPSVLWAVDRITFRTIILKAAHRRRTMYEQFLSSLSLLSSLDPPERSKIADALQSRSYEDGQPVVRQGEMGDTFFFVEDGEAVVTKRHEGGEEIEVGHLKKGDYFGELSLLRLAPRAATVSAAYRPDPSAPKLKTAALDAAAFTRLLGPLREIMERKASESYSGYRPNPR
ncbi:hypothetical protein PC9H_005158 [Pleurotus ostreatus]|uniref:cAMP-dependent protein kinase regulatory subunit n=1 Tax=Pleurotus ostreatus TaxID=5322 RepID=A0A8H7DWR7_PLEOS|nr:uncharacterized protein PC9H_005158 [Pleurotus ostreatus]KAF7433208.1 hypothetical protein PC9H_005158 [Pleurotus ostreatus]KAJ8698144.1 hypothetical protein PTI98_004882 [Pleurotus ostreatus]